jgi:hypothetical protein
MFLNCNLMATDDGPHISIEQVSVGNRRPTIKEGDRNMNMRAFALAMLVVLGAAGSASAQNYDTSDPNSAPFASSTGGRPVPLNRAEVRRDNTADPNSAPFASPTGGRPVPVDPAEVRRDNTADPG